MTTYNISKNNTGNNNAEVIAQYSTVEEARAHMIRIMQQSASMDEHVMVDAEDVANEVSMLESIGEDAAEMIERIQNAPLPCIMTADYQVAETLQEDEDGMSFFYDGTTYRCRVEADITDTLDEAR